MITTFFLAFKGLITVKLRAWTDILISLIMLIISGYLLADSSALSLDLLSNPNLNVAIELIRFFWGVVGIIYFLYYLYHGICFIRPATVSGRKATVRVTKRKSSSRKKRRPRRKSRKRKSNKTK